jgi:predicted patatin/cPLA2 family phospholipase
MTAIFEMLKWYKDKDDICDHVLKMEKRIERLTSQVAHYEKQSKILNLFPDVRGKRYDDIHVPQWVQFDDMEALGQSVADYLIKDVGPARRLK